jgi:uncharacterized membrane protein YidH (DUF202 family)
MIDSSTELARERSLEAATGTLLAWIRTVLALIGFGCGVGKFYGYLRDAGLHERLDPIRRTLSFGASLIVLGTLGLLAAVVQQPEACRESSGRTKDFIAHQVAADKPFFA